MKRLFIFWCLLLVGGVHAVDGVPATVCVSTEKGKEYKLDINKAPKYWDLSIDETYLCGSDVVKKSVSNWVEGGEKMRFSCGAQDVSVRIGQQTLQGRQCKVYDDGCQNSFDC